MPFVEDIENTNQIHHGFYTCGGLFMHLSLKDDCHTSITHPQEEIERVLKELLVERS